MIASLPIRQVTLFGDRAEVVRRGEIEVEPGAQEVVIDDLPRRLDHSTVRASARGSVPARLTATDVRSVVLEQTLHPEALAIRERLDALDVEGAARSLRRDSIALRRRFLDTFAVGGGRALARALARGGTDTSAGAAISGFLAEHAAALDAEAGELGSEERAAAGERAALEARAADLALSGDPKRRQIAVGVDASERGTLELEVRYQVHGCSWAPLYDVHLTSAPGSTTLTLTYLAEVTQASGEDWDGVELTLSTARAGGGTSVPELQPWVLRPHEPQARTMVAMSRAGTPLAQAPPQPEGEITVEPAALRLRGAAAASPAAVAAELAGASVDSESPAVTFHIGGDSRIPSDGSPHKVLVGDFPLEHRIDYITAPKLAAEAYRRATVTNTSTAPLLPGRAQLFVDAQMVGVTRVPLTAPRDEVELSVGVDDRIRVKREMSSGGAERKLLQDRRVLTHGFRIEVTNLTGAPQRVTVRDQLPVSHDERIRVRDAHLSPPPAARDEMGRLEWTLEIADGARREIAIGYSIEHPRDLVIANLPGVL